jgi:hypothetical protein
MRTLWFATIRRRDSGVVLWLVVHDMMPGQLEVFQLVPPSAEERSALRLLMEQMRRVLVSPSVHAWSQLSGTEFLVEPPSMMRAPSARTAGYALCRAMSRAPTVAGLLGQVATPPASTSRRSL